MNSLFLNSTLESDLYIPVLFVVVFFCSAPSCTCQGVSASAEATYSVLRRRALGPHRGPLRLPSTGSCQRTSAKTSCSSGASPARLHSPASGSSSSDAAMARCAATASRPDQRATQAAHAAARSGAGISRAPLPSEQAELGGCLGAKSAADCNTDNNQAAAAGALKLKVRLTAFAPRGAVDGAARVHVRTRLSVTSPGDGADDGGVCGLLRAMPESKSVPDDFDAAVASYRHIDIHVGQADITGNTRAVFSKSSCWFRSLGYSSSVIRVLISCTRLSLDSLLSVFVLWVVRVGGVYGVDGQVSGGRR